MRHAELDVCNVGVKNDGHRINNLRYADDTTLVASTKEEFTDIICRVKRANKNLGLYWNVSKTKILSSSW